MNAEAFITWALDSSRSTEERYTTLLLVERGVDFWNSHHNTGVYRNWCQQSEEQRQRRLNPAFDPRYSEEDLVRACEMLPKINTWYHHGYSQRPLRDLTAFGFLTEMESMGINNSEVTDLTPLARITALHTLDFSSAFCDDFSPLARCLGLRNLNLSIGVRWPDVTGLEALEEIETLSLVGNLLAFAPGVAWPNVRRGTLVCSPLCARNVDALPFFPRCEFLTLAGVDRLDGIERYAPRLRNLTLTGPVRSLAPLASLSKLTWLSYGGDRPRDVSPLARLPQLHAVIFSASPDFQHPAKPRDYCPLAAAPALRELTVLGCPPVEMEVAALKAGLPPCDDLWLAESPRSIPPLRFIVAPTNKAPRRASHHRAPGEPDLADTGVRTCEGLWVKDYAARIVRERLGHDEWGTVTANGEFRTVMATVESFDIVEKFREIVEAIRFVLASLRHDYHASVMIALRVPPPKATPAQQQLEEQFRNAQDRADFEQRQRDDAEYLEKLHLHELAQQEGDPVKPEEYAPADPEPPLVPPWEQEDDEEEDDSHSGDIGIAIKKKPDPPPSWSDDEHPLADNYRLLATLTLGELWCLPHQRDIALYLMHRAPDEEIPEEPKP